MRIRFRFVALLSILSLTMAGCGANSDGSEGNDGEGTAAVPEGIVTQSAWIRPAVLPVGSPTADPEHEHDEATSSGVISALYLVLQNNGGSALQLTGIETDVARVVEMHQTENQNGLMQMRPVPSIEVPAGGEVVFEPGGFHIMLIDITRQLEPGDDVAVTLVFDNGERLDIPAVPVQES